MAAKKASSPAEAAERVLADEARKDAPPPKVTSTSETRARKKRGKYWHPRDFRGDPDAERINELLDKVDPQKPGAATRCEVGESTVATIAEFGSLDIHPAWFLALNATVAACMVLSHRWDAEKLKAKSTAGPKSRASTGGFAGLIR